MCSRVDLSVYLLVFIVGRAIAGLGSTPCLTLGITYMDDVTTHDRFGLYSGGCADPVWVSGWVCEHVGECAYRWIGDRESWREIEKQTER